MKDDELYKIHIKECIAKIEGYISGIDLDTFLSSAIVQDAVLRNLQIVSESTQRLSEEFKNTHNWIEWYKIAGLRNVLVHDYLGVDMVIVWNILETELGDLKKVVND
jgi:uncharacterized protein with HEPN domain